MQSSCFFLINKKPHSASCRRFTPTLSRLEGLFNFIFDSVLYRDDLPTDSIRLSIYRHYVSRLSTLFSAN